MKRHIKLFESFKVSENMIMGGGAGSEEYKKAVNDKAVEMIERSDLGAWKIDTWWYANHGGGFIFSSPETGSMVLSVSPFWDGSDDLLVDLNIAGENIEDERNSMMGIDRMLTGDLMKDAKTIRDLVTETLMKASSKKNLLRLLNRLDPRGPVEWALEPGNQRYGGEDILKFMLSIGYKPKGREELQSIIDILGDDYMRFSG